MLPQGLGFSSQGLLSVYKGVGCMSASVLGHWLYLLPRTLPSRDWPFLVIRSQLQRHLLREAFPGQLPYPPPTDTLTRHPGFTV